MIKLRILNMKRFLNTVSGCKGTINVIYPDGSKADIQGYGVKKDLQERYRQNRNYLPVSLEILSPADYLDIVHGYIGDC